MFTVNMYEGMQVCEGKNMMRMNVNKESSQINIVFKKSFC